jgi:preprotein translocase subunit SecY
MMTGMRSYLPLRVNTAGVMPVIFASSVLMVPSMIGQFAGIEFLKDLINPSGGPGMLVYALLYSVMIFFFAYFWTYLFFQPNDIALNLKENGSFVPGIRPGENTAAYLNTILARITLCGAAFLCLIALLPDIISAGLGLRKYLVAFLGGTGILICVGVSLDLIQKMESYLLMHNYTGFLGPGGARIQGRRG